VYVYVPIISKNFFCIKIFLHIINMSCERKKKKRKAVRRKNQVEDGEGKDLGEGERGTGLKLGMKICVWNTRELLSLVTRMFHFSFFFFLSLSCSFFFLPCFFFSFFLFLFCGTPRVLIYVYNVLLWFLLKRKRRFLCAMCLYVHTVTIIFHSNDSEKYNINIILYNEDVKWKQKNIFILVSVCFISLIKELSSLMECRARILCLSCNMQGRVSFPLSLSLSPFKRRRRKGETSIMQLCFLYCSRAHIFVCEWWCIVPCDKRKEKKGLAVNISLLSLTWLLSGPVPL